MNYYEDHAVEYAEQTLGTDMSPTYAHFIHRLKLGDRILDLGSGSGRDSCYFLKQGFIPTALEPSKGLCVEIAKVFPGEIVNSDILSYEPRQRFDAIWACASLLHMTKGDLMEFFSNIDRYLLPDGIMYGSGKDGVETGNDEKGRYFLNFTDTLLDEIIHENPELTVLEKWYSDDVTGRNGFRWLNFVLKRAVQPAQA